LKREWAEVGEEDPDAPAVETQSRKAAG